jgi:hypothetical protein
MASVPSIGSPRRWELCLGQRAYANLVADARSSLSSTTVRAGKCYLGIDVQTSQTRTINNRHIFTCYSAWGPDADRHDKPLIHMPLEGPCFGVDSHCEFGPLGLAQFDPIAYIHPCLLVRHGRTAESDGRRESRRKNLHAQTGAVSGLYPPLYAPASQAAG